jgi:phosphoribosylformylglycinamidine synthase
VRACHDLSEGGLAVAAAEMAFAGGLGLKIDVANSAPEDLAPVVALFSESASRFLVEVTSANQKAFEAILEKAPVFATPLGKVVAEKKLTVTVRDQVVIEESLDALKEAWQKPLRW